MEPLTVMINGEQYVSLKQCALIRQAAAPDRPLRVASNEAELIDEARAALSESHWTIGRVAAYWMRHHSRGRTDADLGAYFGLSADQVYQRRRVWETFADLRQTYPNLIWSHFYTALTWEDAAECLKWADDVQANVAEMRAWRRAQHGENLCPDNESEVA